MGDGAGPAFEERSGASHYALLARDFREAVAALGLERPEVLDDALARGAAQRGRSHTAVVALPGRAERLHLRPVHHGGWLGGLFRDRLLGVARPVAELRLTALLHAEGAPVPRPVLVLARRRAPFWTAVLGTVHEEGALDGLALLEARPERARVLRAAAAAGAAVRRFHDAGARHADLHVKNLLFDETGGATRAVVIDLDGARLDMPDPRRRMRELMRLYRSLVKRRLTDAVGARGCAVFLSAYTRGDRALRRALMASLPAERRRIAIHALGYR